MIAKKKSFMENFYNCEKTRYRTWENKEDTNELKKLEKSEKVKKVHDEEEDGTVLCTITEDSEPVTEK